MRIDETQALQNIVRNLSNDSSYKDLHNVIDAVVNCYVGDLQAQVAAGTLTPANYTTKIGNINTDRNSLVAEIA
jgi:hypothetical protein